MPYSLSRATLWNIISYSYLLIASFLTTPALIHSLGLPGFAHYLLALGIITVASTLDLGLPRALIQRFGIIPLKRSELFAVSRTLTLGVSFITGLVACLVSVSAGLAPQLILPIFLLVLVGGLTSIYQSVPESEGSFGWVAVRAFLVGTGNTFGALYLASHGYDLFSILLLLLILTSLTLIIFFLYVKQRLKPISLFVYTPQLAHSLLSFGLPNQGGKIVGQLQAQYAKFLFLANPLALSGYGVASGLLSKLVGGVTQLATAFYPLASNSVGQKHFKTLYWRLQAGLLFLGFLGIWLYAQFGLSFLTWWLKDPSLVALIHPLLSLGSYSAALLLLTPLASAVMDSHGAPGTTSLFGLAALVIEIILALVFLKSYGPLSPMLAQLVSLMILVPLFLYATGKKLSPA